MSILDKHPAPWRIGENRNIIVDGTCSPGDEVFDHGHVAWVDVHEDIVLASPEVERLILAAPELLAALKKYVDRDRHNRGFLASDNPNCGGRCNPSALEMEGEALIARIEGGK